MNKGVLRSPNSHRLRDAVSCDDVETKRPARTNEITEANTTTASTGVSLQYPQRPLTSAYKNSNSSLFAMNKDARRPPNSHALNDAVIYDGVETKRSARNIAITVASTAASTRVSFQYRISEHILSTELARTHLGEDGAAVAVNRPITTARLSSLMKTDQQTAIPAHRLSPQDAAGLASERKPEAMRTSSPYEATVQQVIAERERIRVLRRERQIRYRKKKHDYMLIIEAEAKILRQQIKNLKQRRSSLSAVDSTEQNIWNVAVEYFKPFRYGLRVEREVSANTTINSSIQLSFLRTSMSPDVVFNTQQGINAMITSWRYITYAFQALEMELESLVRSVDGSLVATTRTSVSISEHTLCNVFPHLCGDGDADLNRLAGKLVGHRFHMCGVTRFEWNAASRRISTVISQAGMLAPMLRLLGGLEDVSRVYQKSRMSLDFQWSGALD